MQTSQLDELCQSMQTAPVFLNLFGFYEAWQKTKNVQKEHNRLISVIVNDNDGKHLIPALACRYKKSMIYLVQNNIFEGYIILYSKKIYDAILLPFGVLTTTQDVTEQAVTEQVVAEQAVAEQMFHSTFESGESSKYKIMQ